LSGEPSGPQGRGRECPPEHIIYDHERGVRVCTLTGEVIEEGVIDERVDYRAYDEEERRRRARVGGPLSPAKQHMGVTVGYAIPSAGKPRGLSRIARLERIRRQYYAYGSSLSSIEKNINQALRRLDELVQALGVPAHVKEEAARIYREAAQKGLTRGRSIDSVVAAALYAACRKRQIACSIQKIAEALNLREGFDPKREIARCYRLLVRDLNLRIPVISPESFVSQITSELGLPDSVAAEAVRIVRLAREAGITAGKDPNGVAAAAVYIAAIKQGFRKTQKDVASKAGVTEVTVRNRYKEIVQYMKDKLGVDIEKLEQQRMKQAKEAGEPKKQAKGKKAARAPSPARG